MALPSVILQRNTRALQPAANTVATGTLYCVTDENDIVEQSDGSSWLQFGSNTNGAMFWTGSISPTSLAADQNNYNPTSLSTASNIRQDCSANVNITGLAGGAAGRVLVITNISAANTITLKNESASSTAANRFVGSGNADVTLAVSGSCVLRYDGTSSRWRIIAVSASAGGGTGTVTSVSSTDALITIATATTTPALTMAMRITPQGRLTLTSGTPVLTTDTTAAGTVYYTPYIGDMVPIYNGTNWTIKALSEISLTLNITDNVSGSLYDIFVFNNAGTLTLGTGPAWTSSTARGAGAGTTQISMLNGIWTNTVAITLRAGGVSLGSQAANTCTYLGTAYMTANGQTGMAFLPAAAAGGTNNILGLYNAYNRVRVSGECRDSTASWTYNSTTYHAANASNSNRVSFIDGLQQSRIETLRSITGDKSTADAVTGVNLDSTSTAPGHTAQSNASTLSSLVTREDFAPQLGFHFVQAVEAIVGTGSATFFGAQSTPTRQLNNLNVALEM